MMSRYLPYVDNIHEMRTSIYVRACDCILYLLLLLEPFSHAFVDRDAGTGFFLKYFYLLFFICSLPIWRRYFRCWPVAILAYFGLLTIGTAVDLSSFGIGYLFHGFPLIRQHFMGILFAVATYNLVVAEPKQLKIIVSLVLINSLSTAFFMVAGIGVKEGIEHGADGIRYSVVGQNSNSTGVLMVLYIEFALLLMIGAIPLKKIYRNIIFIALPIVLICMIKASSRGSIATFMVTLPLVLLVTKSFSKKIAVFMVSAFVGIGMIALVLSSTMLRSRLENTIYNRDTGGREYIWGVAIDVWRDNPWFGAGLTRHPIMISDMVGMAYSRNMPNRAAHNTYIRALAASGVIGFALYFFSLLFIGRVAWKNRTLPWGNYLFVCYAAFLCFGITGNVENHTRYFLFWALVLGLNYNIERARGMGFQLK